ncbi:hypothetical protein B0T20DRAFT_496725, partial [Sordaria brevicollis]
WWHGSHPRASHGGVIRLRRWSHQLFIIPALPVSPVSPVHHFPLVRCLAVSPLHCCSMPDMPFAQMVHNMPLPRLPRHHPQMLTGWCVPVPSFDWSGTMANCGGQQRQLLSGLPRDNTRAQAECPGVSRGAASCQLHAPQTACSAWARGRCLTPVSCQKLGHCLTAATRMRPLNQMKPHSKPCM